MKELIVKRYVKALFESFSKDELKKFLNSLLKISALYDIDKFKTILESPDVVIDEKIKFVLMPVEDSSKHVKNFIKLLAENDRLMLLPAIAKELQIIVSQNDNIYEGEIVTGWDISKENIKKLEDGFGKKFGATVKLTEVKSDYPGVKIAIDNLGIEANFSVDRLKAQIREHILKAI